MKDTSKSLLDVAIAIASLSTVATAFKIGLRHYTHYQLLLVSAISALLVFAVAVSFLKKMVFTKNNQP